MRIFRTRSAEETASLGQKLGGQLSRGDTVCLTGDLGTGKTAFTGGIAKGLGIGGYITSPTFTLVNEYVGRLPMAHFDVYRIGDPGEMFETGYEEYVGGDGVTVIEWADLIRELLPEERIEVSIEKDEQEMPDSRRIMMNFFGARTRELEGRMQDESTGD